MMKMDELPDFTDVENKLGRKVPESLIRSFTGEPAARGSDTRAGDMHALNNKIRFLRQQMALLRSVDVKLMQQLLAINEGIESIRWAMEERGGGASGGGSLTGSLFSLSDSPEASPHGSCSDGLDGVSLGSFLDALGDGEPDEPLLKPAPVPDEYYCFS